MIKQATLYKTSRHSAKAPHSLELAPPWHSSETWHEANQTVAYLISFNGSRLNRVVKLFQDVKDRLEWLIPQINALCANTCPWCPDACCLSATVWFDFADLLFLHLSGRSIPPSQPRQNSKIPCRYLGPRGCSLPRISRPWICTWYLCDSQLAHLRKQGHNVRDVFNHALQAIKDGRKEMEAEFIRVVAKSKVEGSKGNRM